MSTSVHALALISTYAQAYFRISAKIDGTHLEVDLYPHEQTLVSSVNSELIGNKQHDGWNTILESKDNYIPFARHRRSGKDE